MTYERTGFGLTCAPPLPNGCYKIDRLKRFHFIADARTRSLAVSLLKWARAANPNKEFALMARTILASPWEQVTDDE